MFCCVLRPDVQPCVTGANAVCKIGDTINYNTI